MSTARNKIIATVLLTSLFFYLFKIIPSPVYAAHSCTATVSPTSVEANTVETPFTFSITNTGTNPVTYIKVVVPSSNFQLYNYGVTGWSVGANTTQAQLTGGSLAAGDTFDFSFKITAGSTEAASADWTITTYDGVEIVNCTGTLGTAISGAADVTAPVLSDPSVSGITSSSAVITWTSDELSDSTVNYGIGDYSQTKTGNSSTTEHSVSLTGLTGNTTYYYEYCSQDSSGNQQCYSGNNLTTASGSTSTSTPTPTATATATATATSTSTATPTPTPFVDRVAPNVSITTEIVDTYEQAPLIEGKATDAIGVTEIEYSIDGGANWLPVDELSEDLPSTSAEYSFTPNIFEDGNYDILTRALDEEGNIGESDKITIIIDRLPPRVGGNLVSLGPLPLYPNQDGSILTIPGLEQKIVLSTVGGATSVDLFVNESMSSLGFNAQTGLWAGVLNLSEPGRYKLRTRAIDGADNVTERDLNEVLVVPPGKISDINGKDIVSDGKVSLYVQDPLTKLWSLWDAATFGQENPQGLIDGTYSFFVPPGVYYMSVTETGRPKLTTKIFEVTEARPLVSDLTLLPRKSFSLGPITIPLPDIFADKADIIFKQFGTGEGADSLLGEQAPYFSLPGTNDGLNLNELLGERTILTFVNTWAPPAVEQLPILDSYYRSNLTSHAIIAVEETIPRVTIFQRRGKYDIQILSDKDGELVEDYNITSLPKHVFLDRRGVVQKVVNGVLSEEEIKQYLSEI